MENICTKQYPTDIANYIQNSVLSVDDKICIVEHGPCRSSGPFSRNASGRGLDEAFYYTVSKVGLLLLCYSLELHKHYCQPCWLFRDNSIKHQEWIRGFNDWPIHHEELKDMKNLYLIKWHVWLFIHFKIITQSTKTMKSKSEMKQIIEHWY